MWSAISRVLLTALAFVGGTIGGMLLAGLVPDMGWSSGGASSEVIYGAGLVCGIFAAIHVWKRRGPGALHEQFRSCTYCRRLYETEEEHCSGSPDGRHHEKEMVHENSVR